MKKIMFCFGTRPEAIKLAPVIKEFQKNNSSYEVIICLTGQHKEMLDHVLSFFEIIPNYNLEVMQPGQSLSQLTAKILLGLDPIIEREKPNYILVHGDTTTTMACSLVGFYHKIIVCHVEAGLRTFDKYSPFPEEINRCITALTSNFHFAPTLDAQNNLIQQGINQNQIVVTGNSVIDSLLLGVSIVDQKRDFYLNRFRSVDFTKKLILVTVHRRENHENGILTLCEIIKTIMSLRSDIFIVIPVHPNPNVKKVIFENLENLDNVLLLEPLGYDDFIWIMKSSYLILTDSGGVQEEAPTLKIPILVLRETTERPEAVKCGAAILTGLSKKKVVSEILKLLEDNNYYKQHIVEKNPFGNGSTSKRISEFIQSLD